MIDHEQELFEGVASALRSSYPTVYVSGDEFNDVPPSFPAVSFRQEDNSIDQQAMILTSIENMASESYVADVFTNKQTGARREVKEVTEVISDYMVSQGYIRTFCQAIENIDRTYTRMVSRYASYHTKGE